MQVSIPTRAHFHIAAKQTNVLSMKFLPQKIGLRTKFPRDLQDKQTTAEYQ